MMKYRIAKFFTLGTLLVFGLGNGDDRTDGVIQDDHGHLRWESSATSERPNGWVYNRSLENRDTKLKCRIHWTAPAGKTLWKTTVKPMGFARAGISVPTQFPPLRVEGTLLYNGGQASGDGPPAPAPCVLPRQFKEVAENLPTRGPIMCWGDVSFDLDKNASANFSLFCYSNYYRTSNGTYSYNYLVLSSGVKEVAAQFGQTPVRWRSIESPERGFNVFIGKMSDGQTAIDKTFEFKSVSDNQGTLFPAFFFKNISSFSKSVEDCQKALDQAEARSKGESSREVRSQFTRFVEKTKIGSMAILLNLSFESELPPTLRHGPIQFYAPKNLSDPLAEVSLPAWTPRW